MIEIGVDYTGSPFQLTWLLLMLGVAVTSDDGMDDLIESTLLLNQISNYTRKSQC